MRKQLYLEEAILVSKKLHDQGKKIVLAGGVFDILHAGHIAFLQKSKEAADILFVMVENDQTVQRIKGPNRPINTQKQRASIVASLPSVDFVILLPPLTKHDEYDSLVQHLKPDIIATTAPDSHRVHKERQAQKYNARVVDVLNRIGTISTTQLIASTHKK